jgi:hypothetical protein
MIAMHGYNRGRSCSVILAVVLAISALLSGCIGANGDDAIPVIGTVELQSQGKTFSPVLHFVCSTNDGLALDCAYFGPAARTPDLSAALDKAEEIPYTDDFSFTVVSADGAREKYHSYQRVFDDQYRPVDPENLDRSRIPDQPGIYYIATFASWEKNGNSAGYEYIFKIRVPGTPPSTQPTDLFVGRVELDTQGKTYSAMQLLADGYQDDALIEGWYFGPDALDHAPGLKEALQGAEAINLANDFAFFKTTEDDQRKPLSMWYYVYDETLQVKIAHHTDLDPLQTLQRGINYLVITLEWGYTGNFLDYQYIFKIIK